MVWDFFRKNQERKKAEWERTYSPESLAPIDYSLLICIGALLLIGLVMVFSATISLADSPKYETSPYYFVVRQFIYILIGLVAGWVVFRLPMRSWQKWSLALGILGVCFLALVFVPGLGVNVNGSIRWIRLGPINLQVSEIAKFVSVIVVAQFTVSRQLFMHSVIKGLIPILVYLLGLGYLLMAQPDLGATIVIIAIVIGIIFLGGLSYAIVAFLAGVFGAGIVGAIVWSPWRMQRILAYLDPWDPENMLGKAYQLTHSLIAFGRGELFGVGLGASIEKMHYLPEAHTDFILAVLGEELGLVGVTVVILLFYWLTRRAFEVGRQAVRLDQFFSGLVAQGIGLWLGVQACFNIGVVLGVLPTKGLTLPLVSYGGSSLVVTLAALALLLRVDYENRLLMHGKGSR